MREIGPLWLLDTWMTPQETYGDMLCLLSVVFYIWLLGLHKLPLHRHWVEFLNSRTVIENIVSASVDRVMSRKWVKLQLWMNWPFKCLSLRPIWQKSEISTGSAASLKSSPLRGLSVSSSGLDDSRRILSDLRDPSGSFSSTLWIAQIELLIEITPNGKTSISNSEHEVGSQAVK